MKSRPLVILLLATLCLICIDSAMVSAGITIPLQVRPPHRLFEEPKRGSPHSAGPLPDSRIYGTSRKRETVPLGGGIGTLGTYYCEITVAQQTFRVVVDTGSSVLYIPSTECTLMNGPNAGQRCFTYNEPLDLNTAPVTPIECTDTGCECNTQNQCFISTRFGDGSSVEGLGYRADVQVGNLSASDASFAAMTQSSDNFVNDQGTVLDGLWGLGYQRYPNDALVTVTPVLDTIFAQNPDLPQIFSIELDQTGGSLTIGGIDSQFVRGPIMYTPIVAQGWYVISNPDLAVGSSPSTLSRRDVSKEGTTATIVDSGATLIVLPNGYFEALESGMQDVAGCDVEFMCGANSIFGDRRLCYQNFPFDQYPTIAFILPSATNDSNVVTLVLEPRQYMIASVDVQGNPCYAFGIQRSDSDFLIFGDTLMVNYYVIFDRENNRIGFSAKNDVGAIAPQSPVAPTGSLGPTSDAHPLLKNTEFLFVLTSVIVTWTVVKCLL